MSISKETQWLRAATCRVSAMDLIDEQDHFTGTQTMPLPELLRCVTAAITAGVGFAASGNVNHAMEVIEEACVMSMIFQARKEKQKASN